MIEIPLSSNPEQLFSIELENEVYDLRVILNSRTGVWSVSFAQNGEDIVTGIALLGGIDILKQYTLPVKNMYVVNLENSSADPGKTDLGTVARLFLLTDEEVADGSSI